MKSQIFTEENSPTVTEIAAVLNEYGVWDSKIKVNGTWWNTVGHFHSKAEALDHAYCKARVFYRLDVVEIQELVDMVKGDIYIAIDREFEMKRYT